MVTDMANILLTFFKRLVESKQSCNNKEGATLRYVTGKVRGHRIYQLRKSGFTFQWLILRKLKIS